MIAIGYLLSRISTASIPLGARHKSLKQIVLIFLGEYKCNNITNF